jgi:hypothetical protein
VTGVVISMAGLTVAVVIVVGVLSLKLSSAKDDLADARVDAANRKAQGVIDAGTIATLTSQVATEKERANALDDLLAKGEADAATTVSPGDALDRILLSWKRARASQPPADSGAGHVPTPPSTTST